MTTRATPRRLNRDAVITLTVWVGKHATDFWELSRAEAIAHVRRNHPGLEMSNQTVMSVLEPCLENAGVALATPPSRRSSTGSAKLLSRLMHILAVHCRQAGVNTLPEGFWEALKILRRGGAIDDALESLNNGRADDDDLFKS